MYTVKVLSEVEFDKLPYRHTKTSLGLADAKTGVAYVRDTGYNDLTKDTISHELDELMATVSPHEEDGIRYKNLASLGAGAGAGVLSSMVPFLRPFQGALSAGAGALAADKGNRLQGALQGFSGGGIGTGVGGGVFDAFKGVSSPGGTFGKALQNFVPGVERGLTQYAGTVPGFGGVGTDNPTGALAKFFSGGAGAPTQTTAKLATQAGQTGGTSGIPTPGQVGAPLLAERLGGQTGAGTVSSTIGQDTPLKPGTGTFSISEAIKKALPGLAIAGAGDLFAPKVNAPDTSGIQSRLDEQIKTGGEPMAKEAGLNEMFRILGSPIDTPPEAAFNQGDIYADRQLTDDLTALRNEFKAVNPNANVDSNSAFLNKKQELIERSREQRTAARDELSFQFETQQLQTKYNTMVQALNLDQSQMSQYVQLAQMEIDQMMLQYGIDAQTAANFKTMFADLGRLQGQQPSGLDNYFNSLAQKNATA